MNEISANISVCSTRNAPGMMEGAATSEHGACQTFCAMGLLRKEKNEKDREKDRNKVNI